MHRDRILSPNGSELLTKPKTENRFMGNILNEIFTYHG